MRSAYAATGRRHPWRSPGKETARLIDNEYQPARRGLADWQARQVVAYIDSNLERRILASDIATHIGLSDSHLFRLFKMAFDTTPRCFISQRRIQRAQQLISCSRMSLSQIALECGLCDQSHFTRLFKSVVGENPGAWRRHADAPTRP